MLPTLKKPPPIRRLAALLPLALLFLVPASAVAADTYEASWNGGHLTATASADFTEATIETVSVGFDQCGTAPEEATCTWEATATLHSGPESRCNPATPEDQVAWDSGEQSGNGTVTDGPKSFALEGCKGQSLVFRIDFHKTYEETDEPPVLRITGGGTEWTMFTFGYHPFEEADKSIPTEYNPPPYEYPHLPPSFTPKRLRVASDCRSLTIGNVRYVFAFGQMGCHRAGNLARARFRSGHAPHGYVCQGNPKEGVRCWRRHQPDKFFEWRPLRPID
jgi:hypothetical protein